MSCVLSALLVALDFPLELSATGDSDMIVKGNGSPSDSDWLQPRRGGVLRICALRRIQI
jgi:hypothetical protein